MLHACEVNSSPYDQLRFHHAPILELCRGMNSHMKRSASVHIDIGNFQPLHLISASLDFEIGNIQSLGNDNLYTQLQLHVTGMNCYKMKLPFIFWESDATNSAATMTEAVSDSLIYLQQLRFYSKSVGLTIFFIIMDTFINLSFRIYDLEDDVLQMRTRNTNFSTPPRFIKPFSSTCVGTSTD
nr:hypothetical protein Iba_chr02cCG8470 [Ipomoea batatas]